MATMVSQSVYKDDFPVWITQKLQPSRLCDNLKPDKGKFWTTTTSKDSYCRRDPVPVRETFKRAPQTGESLPFEGTTNYRLQYVTHPVQPQTPSYKPTYRPSSALTARIFTSRHDYKGLPSEPAKSFKPKVAWENNQVAFEGISEFRDKFKVWPLRPLVHHKPEEYRPPEARAAFLSTAHADYVAHECRRPTSAQPPVQAWEKDKEPLQATSTMKEDYKAWETVRRPRAVRREELERPDGAFEKTTTARSSYTNKTAQRVVSFKPPPRPPSSDRMEEASVYRSSYTARDAHCLVLNGAPLDAVQHQAAGAAGHRLHQSISVDAPVTNGVKTSHVHSRITFRVPSRAERAS